VVFYDSVLELELSRFDFHEPVLGLRLTSKYMAVILAERTILFKYQQLPTESKEILRAPNIVHSLHQTSTNHFALACLSNTHLILPASAPGQLHVISLNRDNTTTKRVIRAHNNTLRCISLSQDGSLIATASNQGTLIRIFSTADQSQLAEFRRGMDNAIIFNLAFSPGNRWVACTSDKGTLHIFDLKPTKPPLPTKYRQKPSSYATANAGPGTISHHSSSQQGRSSPSAHGSVQEYYGLRPPPPPALAPTGTLTNTLKSRIFKDVYSVCHAPFHLGVEKSHWQGGHAYTHIMAPNGKGKKVANAVLGLPNDPSGRAVKGICTFAPVGVEDGEEEESAVVFVIGGGRDSRWEMFEVGRAQGGEWKVELRGFRRFLTRQFVE
jgi:hypothetical protein